MTKSAYCPLAVASSVLFVLTACAASPPAAAAAGAVAPAAVDLGPSTRIPATRATMAEAARGLNGAAPLRQSEGGDQLVHDGGNDAHGTGTVNAVDAAQHRINVSHNPIPAIGWPAMTMDFPVAPSVDLARLRPGTRIDFTIQKGNNGMYQIQSVRPAGAAQ